MLFKQCVPTKPLHLDILLSALYSQPRNGKDSNTPSISDLLEKTVISNLPSIQTWRCSIRIANRSCCWNRLGQRTNCPSHQCPTQFVSHHKRELHSRRQCQNIPSQSNLVLWFHPRHKHHGGPHRNGINSIRSIPAPYRSPCKPTTHRLTHGTFRRTLDNWENPMWFYDRPSAIRYNFRTTNNLYSYVAQSTNGPIGT